MALSITSAELIQAIQDWQNADLSSKGYNKDLLAYLLSTYSTKDGVESLNAYNSVLGVFDVNLKTSLSEDIDSINVGKMSSGSTVVALDNVAVSSTSAEIDCQGYNSVRIECLVTNSGNHTFSITGSETTGETFGSIYNMNSSTPFKIDPGAITSDGKRIYTLNGGVPNFIKVSNTASAGNATVKVTPYNI